MKTTPKKRLLIFMLLAIIRLAAVTAIGVFSVFVLGERYRALEFISGFYATFVFLCGGIAFFDYEGRGTPLNVLLNGLFYFFLVAAVVCFVLYLKRGSRGSKK